MGKVFSGVRAPSTLGTFLRTFAFGHVRQLDAIHSRVLTGLATAVPRLLAGTDTLAFVDIDDTIREVHGYVAGQPEAQRELEGDDRDDHDQRRR